MLNPRVEPVVSRLLFLGTPLVSLFILTGIVTDPVNVTKMWIAGGLGFALISVVLGFGLSYLRSNFFFASSAVSIFIFAMFWTVLKTNSPLSQNIYGAYGRNTGLLTYLVLAFALLGSMLVRNQDSFKRIIYAFLVAGFINVLYCAWVLIYGDFIAWNNPYKSILGLFGNPDFISAFLGMTIAAVIALIVIGKFNLRNTLLGIAYSAVAFLEIIKSHAIQGLAVTFGGVAIVLAFKIKQSFKSIYPTILYVMASSTLGFVAILGTLQKGPLSFVYKKSVSLRGSYWHAGIKMGDTHPFSGVGMDTYGDLYRRARPPVALVDTPGVNIVSNASHNVVVDIFAFGGVPLLVAYLLIIGLTGRAIIKVTARSSNFSPVFVAMATTWICYEVQSVISINQVGLAIWGWVLSGLLIAYEFNTREDVLGAEPGKARSKQRKNVDLAITPSLLAGVGLVIGLIVTSPPLAADSKWISALNSKNLENVKLALAPSYMNPSNSAKYFNAVQVLANSNLQDLALNYAREGVKFNPENFDAWKQLYFLTSTPEEKTKCVENLKRLDPLNPDVTSTQ